MNYNELQTQLSELFKDLKSGSVKPTVACEMNNTAGKMIAHAKLRLDYTRFGKPADASNRIQLLETAA